MRVEGRRFRLGFGAVELGFRALESIDLRQRLHGLLARVARESGESSLLGVVSEHGNSARLIDRVEAREMIRISLEIGHLWPLHAGALGKALLAYMPDREITLEQPPEQVGKNTITDTVVLRRELEKIREIGWAMSVEETDAGVWGVAKTILDNDGMPIAAIGLVAPLGRLTPEYTSRLVALLEAALPEARKRLGLDASDDES